MRTQGAVNCWTSLIVAALACSGAGAADWPNFLGDGDRTPPKQGQALVDHLDDAPVLWELKHPMGVGKGLYPGHMRLAREHGIEPFYAGAASPVVAGGTVYVSYYKPDGKVRAKVEPWRTVSEPKEFLPDWFFSVTADDILVAVDAETGKIKWEKSEKGKGHNRLGHKRGHWCVSPVVADGRVFSMGTAGRLYAYDAASGEKLWETIAVPSLQEQLREHLQSKKLCWKASEKSSLVVVGDTVIVPREGLFAFDVKTGKERWKISDRIISRHATPVPWYHDGRDYFVVNDGRGTVRLVDPRDGSVLWTHEGLGEQIGSLNVTGDVVTLNARSKKSSDKKKNGLFGAYRLTTSGLEPLWTLPDRPEYRHSWTLDRGAERRASIQDGRVFLVVGLEEDRLMVADLKSGRILSEEVVHRAHAPYLMEDRLLLFHDRAHTDPVVASWWSIEGDPKPLHGPVGFGPRTITAYEVPIEWPYVDGRLYARTLKGLACFDLRKPADTPENQTLHLTLPAKVIGGGSDVHVTLTQRNGKLTHGGFREARRLHAIDTSQAKWDGARLTGTLRIDANAYRRFGEYEVDATLGEDGHLEGTVTGRAAALRKPIKLRGDITAMPRQAHWMPPCTHVLELDRAAFQQGGRPGRLLLFLTIDQGRLECVDGFADQTTQARPVVDAEELALDDGRLTGTVRVRYRADEWAQPLSEASGTAAGEYRLEARTIASGRAGSYEGVYGIAWSVTAPLAAP